MSAETAVNEKAIASTNVDGSSHASSPTPSVKEQAIVESTETDVVSTDSRKLPPFWAKVVAVIMISLISFGSNWSAGITSAMKSTLKKELNITNTQYSVLEASDDFMVTCLILVTGLCTDRFGGARLIVWGNIVYTIGSILVAAATEVRSYKFMIFGRIILSLGDISTQVAQYKIFSSWFPPSSGFASTLGFELAIGKIGGFVGKSTANIISQNTGDFSWTYWVAAFINIFTNLCTYAFWWYTRYCKKNFLSAEDPATKEALTEKTNRLDPRKLLALPWTYWCVMLFSLFQTSTAIVFTQNATELAEFRFNVDSITAGWYSSLSQYAGFFLVPCIGAFIDMYGSRFFCCLVAGGGCLISMAIVCFAESKAATAAAFGIYSVAYSFGPTSIIDGIRTSMWSQSSFGTAYSLKIHMNNAMNIIVRIIAGVLQDADNDTYRRATRLYLFLAAASAVVAVGLIVAWFFSKSVDLRIFMWTRKQRLTHGAEINARREEEESGKGRVLDRRVSIFALTFLSFLTIGGWIAYFWGVATGHNE